MFPGGPANRFSTGHGGSFLATTSVARTLSSTDDAIIGSAERARDHAKLENRCGDCGMLFTAQVDLWYHVRTVHRGRFSCPHCECTLASRGGLNQHVKHIHQKLARYQCEWCEKGYSSRLNYLDHIATHTGVKRYVCPTCTTQFTFRNDLKVHVYRFHPDVARK